MVTMEHFPHRADLFIKKKKTYKRGNGIDELVWQIPDTPALKQGIVIMLDQVMEQHPRA